MAEATLSPPPSLSSVPKSPPPPIQQTPKGNPVFVNFDDKYRCVVCKNVAREAVQTRCGHRGCEECFSNLLKGDPTDVKCPAGEESCCVLQAKEVYYMTSFSSRCKIYDTVMTYQCTFQYLWNFQVILKNLFTYKLKWS